MRLGWTRSNADAYLDELRYCSEGRLLESVNDINGGVLGGNSHFQNVGLKVMARADTEAFVSDDCCLRWDSKLTIERALREVYHLVHSDV